MFNPYFNNAFSNYNSPYISNPAAGMGYTQPMKQEITEVYGISGAQAYQMAANSSVILLDANNPTVYLKRTDGAGSASINVYKLVPCDSGSSTDLEKRVEKLEAIINESYTCDVKQFKREPVEPDRTN